MRSIFHKLSRWLDCMAFANANRQGEFYRLLDQRSTGASAGRGRSPVHDAAFGRWLARWNDMDAATAARGLRARIDENA